MTLDAASVETPMGADTWTELTDMVNGLQAKLETSRMRSSLLGGPFAWTAGLSNRAFGDVFGTAVATHMLLRLMGSEAQRPQNQSYDMLLGKNRVELKTATELNGRPRRYFLFSQIRKSSPWDLLVLLGVRKEGTSLSVIPRAVVDPWMAMWTEAWSSFLNELSGHVPTNPRRSWTDWKAYKRPDVVLDVQHDGGAIDRLQKFSPDEFRISTRAESTKKILAPYTAHLSPDGYEVPQTFIQIVRDYAGSSTGSAKWTEEVTGSTVGEFRSR